MRRSSTVSTWKKSQASSPDAWLRRNSRQVLLSRRGAGPSPAADRIRRIVPSPTRCSSRMSSPWIGRHPHRAFSLASRLTSSRICTGTGGLPGRFGYSQCRATNRRCQSTNVPGV